jgi:hypothetical protein
MSGGGAYLRSVSPRTVTSSFGVAPAVSMFLRETLVAPAGMVGPPLGMVDRGI